VIRYRPVDSMIIAMQPRAQGCLRRAKPCRLRRREVGFFGKSGGDGSLTVAESSPSRKIGGQPQEIGVQLRPKPTGREESGVSSARTTRHLIGNHVSCADLPHTMIAIDQFDLRDHSLYNKGS
jgi:hypothetical protein